jgi:rhodanese-related sulfurtransferase
VSDISPEKLKQMLGQAPGPILLDVREPHELAGELGRLPGVENIPITSLTDELDRLEKYKDRDIAVICRSGGRAHTAVQIMMQQGFQKVSVLNGGMVAWRSAFGQDQ